MKVILLNAPYPIPKMYGIKRSIPILMYKQLGIGYIAASLEKEGHEVKYLDCPALGIESEEVINFLRTEKPGLIGISCFVHGRFLVYDLLKEIQKELPDLPVVVGGTQITLFAENVFSECPAISLALRGEADFSFTQLATQLEQGLPIDNVPGIVMRDEAGDLVYGPDPECIEDLDTIPFPAWEVYDAHLYNPMPITLSLPTMRADQVITSRGCHWGRCRFCYQSNTNMPCYRRRSPENVVEELRILAEKHGIEFIVFLDDDFLQDEPWINRFCDLYDAAGLKLKWKAHGRVNMVTRAMLHRVAQSGCVHVTYGLESGNQETLNMIRKGTTVDQARQAVKWAHEAGLLVRGYIMFGLPRETPDMTEKSLRFAIELNLDYVSFMPYHVMDGTALEEIALQEGHCVEHDNLDLQMPSYIPDTYESVEQLNWAIRNAYRRYYFRPRYIIRALWSARNPKVWPALLSRVLVGLQIVFLSNR